MLKLKANKNRTFIYTNECKLCGKTESYADLAFRLKKFGKDVFVKQISLWAGWASEAQELNLELPCVLDYDTMRSDTVEHLSKLSDEELKEFLGV